MAPKDAWKGGWEGGRDRVVVVIIHVPIVSAWYMNVCNVCIRGRAGWLGVSGLAHVIKGAVCGLPRRTK